MKKQEKHKRIRLSHRNKLKLSVKQTVLVCASLSLSVVLGLVLLFNLGDTRPSVAADVEEINFDSSESDEMRVLPAASSFKGGSYALRTDLVYFNARPNGDIVNLEWETSAEVNGTRFSVERSQNGRNFVSLAEKPGAGSNSMNVFYSTADENPVIGLSYYRLKYTDADGKCSYSAIETFKNVKDEVMRLPEITVKSIYPNPFSSYFKITYRMEEKAEVEFVLLDAGGREVADELIQSAPGSNCFTYRSPGSLKPGIYYINLLCGEQKMVQKVIKE